MTYMKVVFVLEVFNLQDITIYYAKQGNHKNCEMALFEKNTKKIHT